MLAIRYTWRSTLRLHWSDQRLELTAEYLKSDGDVEFVGRVSIRGAQSYTDLRVYVHPLIMAISRVLQDLPRR